MICVNISTTISKRCDGTMKGILTDCRDGTVREIEVDYEIFEKDGHKIFQLIGGVTGYESFYLDSKYTRLDKMLENGWTACAGTKNKYDELFIPAEEMRAAIGSHR